MKLRRWAAAAGAVLAMAGLAGCRTNVGTAATVDGHRITESDVSQYITVNAQPVTEQGPNGTTVQVSPRSFVLAQLINERLGLKILEKIPSISSTTEAQLDAQLERDLAGKSVTTVAESLGLHGYTEDFYRTVLRIQELGRLLSTEAQNGVDVQKIIKTLDFPVTVNPRYGSWDRAHLQFDADSPVPSYLNIQPGGGAAPGQLTS